MRAERDVQGFALARRGYDRTQVEQRLDGQIAAVVEQRDTVADELRETVHQLEASRAEARAAESARAVATSEVTRFAAQVAELSTIPSTVDGMSQRLQQLVRIAQDDINEMRTRATARATQILTMAQAEAEELRDRSLVERREFQVERAAAEAELHDRLTESEVRLSALRDESDGQRTRLDNEIAERRAAAMKELDADLATGRTALEAELAEQKERHRVAASRVLDSATAEADRVRAESRGDVGAAQRQLDELRSLQHQVSEQLTAVRALLDWTLPQIVGSRPADPLAPVLQAVPSPAVVDDSDDEDHLEDAGADLGADELHARPIGVPTQQLRPSPSARTDAAAQPDRAGASR
jgi:chromosome segregation ATPase